MRFLDHGSCGATPKSVPVEQQAWRDPMEARPVRFFSAEMPHALRSAARVPAEFLGSSGDKPAFVDNATTAVNTVLHSFPWQPGDELVLLRHTTPKEPWPTPGGSTTGWGAPPHRVPVQCIDKRLRVRISGQVHNQAEDCEPLADAALGELRRLK